MEPFRLLQKSPLLLVGRTDSSIQARFVCSPQEPYRASFIISWLHHLSSLHSLSLVRTLENVLIGVDTFPLRPRLAGALLQGQMEAAALCVQLIEDIANHPPAFMAGCGCALSALHLG
jgi:hypothetical protein